MITTLVVDDDFRVSRIHAAYIERVDGFEVIGEAHTLAEAGDAIDEHAPDLVLLDVYLPDGSGLDLVRAMNTRPQRPDCIVITAARDLQTVRTAMQLGVVHFLVKPFTFAALAERLTTYRDLRRRLDTLEPEADQADVDALFGLLRTPAGPPATPRKGHSPQTLELVLNAVRQAPEPVSAAEVADQLGVSRPTAQRYLSYLAEQDLVRLQLKYGSAGRPEHRYSRPR
jgi:response regulator of citrate/malate metabolism